MKQIKIGIGGYLGSGKTLAAKYFGDKGAEVINSDTVVADLYEPGEEGSKAILNSFGSEFIDGEGRVDKSKLGKLVFENPGELDKLNKLVHPLVIQRIEDKIRSSIKEVVVIEAVYFDPGLLDDIVDLIIWIESAPDKIKQRVFDRGGDPDMVETVLNNQKMPERVDFSVENNDSIFKFHQRLDGIWNKICGVTEE